MDSILLLHVMIPYGMVAAAVLACGVQSCNILTLTYGFLDAIASLGVGVTVTQDC